MGEFCQGRGHRLGQGLLCLAYSNLWIALAAGGQVWVNCRLLQVEVGWGPTLLAVLAMFWVYTFAKAVCFDQEADATNDPQRTSFLKAHRIPLIAFGLLGLVGGSVLAAHQSLGTLVAFWAPTLVGLIYDLRLLPKRFRYRRLKDIPGVKGLSVALAWSTLCVGLPLSYGEQASLMSWLYLFGWNTCMWFINTTYFDLGDLTGDRLEGTQTLPVVLGYASTRKILHVLNLLAGVSLAGAVEVGWIAPLATRLLWLNFFQAVLLIRANGEGADISWECDVFFDGIFIFAALTLLW